MSGDHGRAGPVDTGTVEVVVGYLVTLANGYNCRLGPDLGRAQHYAAEQRAVSMEPMYVRRAPGARSSQAARSRGG